MDRKFLSSSTALTFTSSTALTFASSTGLFLAATPAFAADPAVFDAPQAPPPVSNPVSGYVELYGSIGSLDYECGGECSDENESNSRIGGAGRLNWWFNPSWSLQLDAYGAGFQTDGDPTGTSFGGAVHVARRDPSQYALGAMVSVGQTSEFWFGDNTWVNPAVEGQLYINNLTLYGQVGAAFSVAQGCCGSDEPTLLYGALQGRYFVNPNFAIIGDFTIADMDSDQQSTSYRWGIGAEFKADMNPFSGFARYQGVLVDGDDWETTEHVFLAGIKMFVNQPTLLDNDRSGATFLDMNPQFGEFNTKYIE